MPYLQKCSALLPKHSVCCGCLIRCLLHGAVIPSLWPSAGLPALETYCMISRQGLITPSQQLGANVCMRPEHTHAQLSAPQDSEPAETPFQLRGRPHGLILAFAMTLVKYRLPCRQLNLCTYGGACIILLSCELPSPSQEDWACIMWGHLRLVPHQVLLHAGLASGSHAEEGPQMAGAAPIGAQGLLAVLERARRRR